MIISGSTTKEILTSLNDAFCKDRMYPEDAVIPSHYYKLINSGTDKLLKSEIIHKDNNFADRYNK